jgi:tetraprenyl-beta-curcumene synthase
MPKAGDMATRVGNCLALCAVFPHAALSYWFDVFPRICGEIRDWHERANAIPDSTLREFALAVHSTKRGNLEGAAAFAAFTTPANRSAVVRAQVAFQAIYDYVDTLAEQPSIDPVKNGRQLHRALLVSLDLTAPHLDYYTHHSQNADAGYLTEIVDACRTALSTLPSYASVAESVRRLAGRIVSYQSFNLTSTQGSYAALERWASNETPPHSELRWWETAASAGSSLGIFALIAMASRPRVSLCEAIAVENTYFPWIGSLHSLLDSLIDLPEDIASSQHNLVTHYVSADQMATRMQMIAVESVRRSESLPDSPQHILVLTGMVCFYLSADEARLPYARQTSTQILGAMGGLAKPTMFVFDMQRVIRSLRSRLTKIPAVS